MTYCIRDTTTDLYTDEDGNILKADVIFCKGHPFIITEDGYIDHYTTGAMDNIFQVPDSEFKVLQQKVKSQKSERNRSFIHKMLLSLTGNHRTSKRQTAPQKALNEGCETGTSNPIINLDGSYNNKNTVNEVRGSAPIAENRTQNVKQLVIHNFN